MQRRQASTAAQSQAETTHMARRLFVSPRPRRLVLPILAFSLMGSFLLSYPRLDPMPILIGTLAIGVPASVSAALTSPLARALGGSMNLGRSALMAFIGLIVLTAFLLVTVIALTIYAVLLNVPFPSGVVLVAILAYGTILWMRQVLLVSVSNSEHRKSLLPSLLHPGLGVVGLAAIVPLGLLEVLAIVFVFGIFLLSAVAYATIAKRPLLRSFGADGLMLLRHTLDHYGDRTPEGAAELEAFFDSVSVPARVRVAGLAFRSGDRLRALLLAPAVHPGPMGYVSGSDLPTKVVRDLEDLTPNVLVAHGPTTHDENPATSAEVRKIGDAVRPLLAGASFSAKVGRSVRVFNGKATALAQNLGGVVLIVGSFAPNPSDDIDGATGHAAVQEAKLAGAADAVFVDAHNCLQPGAGLTHFGSHESHEIVETARMATEQALAAPTSMFRVGYARRTGFCTPDQGIGARGIEALVLEVDGHRTAYVLFDGNNMVPGLRDEIRDRLRKLVAESEAMTTDNHSVNLTMTGFNAVGAVLDRETILAQAEAAVREAAGNLEAAEVAPLAGEIANFRIFGPEAASRLTTSINSTLAVLRPALYVTLSGAIASAALVLLIL